MKQLLFAFHDVIVFGDRLAKIMTMHYLCRKLFIMLKTKDSWDKLSMYDKADLIKYAVQNGIYNPNTVRQAYNEFAEGGEKDGEMTRVRRANGEYAFVKTKDGHAVTDGTGRYPLYNSSGTVIGTGIGDSFPYVGDVRDEGYLDEITVTPQGMQTQNNSYDADALFKAAQEAERNKEIARNRAIDAKVSQYAFTPEGFFGQALQPTNLLSPTHTTRALWNIASGDGYGNVAQDLFMPNSGWFSDEFAKEHPYWTAAGNMLGDAVALGTGAAIWKMPKYRAALQAENRTTQKAVAKNWDDLIVNRGASTRTYRSPGEDDFLDFMEQKTNKAITRKPIKDTKLGGVYSEGYKYVDKNGEEVAHIAGNKKGNTVFVESSSVAPEYRSSGIGKQMYFDFNDKVYDRLGTTLHSSPYQHMSTLETSPGSGVFISPSSNLWRGLLNNNLASRDVINHLNWSYSMAPPEKIHPLYKGITPSVKTPAIEFEQAAANIDRPFILNNSLSSDNKIYKLFSEYVPSNDVFSMGKLNAGTNINLDYNISDVLGKLNLGDLTK